MNFNKKLAVAVSGAVLLMAGQFALADSTTDIVDALVMKGVLTEEEGRLITKGHTSKTNVTPVLKEKDNNFTIESPNGNNSISLTGRVHFDSRIYDYDDSATASSSVTHAPSATGADTFDIRRARLGVKYKFAKNYSGEIVFNTVGAVNVLDVGYMDVSWFEKAKFRIGQFKMPYSLEQLTSSNNIDFIERSFVDAYIPAKEIGAQVFGEPTKGMTYALAISNGLPAANAVGSEADVRETGKDIVGRVTLNLSEAMGDKETVMHGGLAFSHGDSPLGAGLGGNRATEARGASFYTQPAISNIGTATKTIERTRYGVEGAFATGPFKVQGQYSVLNNQFDLSGTGTSKDVDIKTYYVEALWTLTGEKWADRYKAGAFGAMKPKVEFNSDNFTGGAWEVGARYSNFDASDFNNAAFKTATAASTGTLGNGISTAVSGYAEAKAYTVGVKFVANPNFRIMADYVYTDFRDRIGTSNVTVSGQNYTDEKAILMRTQIMF